MRRLFVRGARRLGLTAAGTMLAFAAVAVAATPAHAAPEGCSGGSGHYEVWGSYITAYSYWFCQNGDDQPRPVSIQRYLQPGHYETVADGMGEVTYYCTGADFNRYHTTNTADFDILCS
jgi:hypothetical protein